MCLDVLRVLQKQPGVMDVLMTNFGEVKGQNRHFDRAWRQLQQLLRKPQEAQGRLVTQQLANLASGSEVLRYLSPPLAEAWCRMVLDPRGEHLIPEPALSDILRRATGGAG